MTFYTELWAKVFVWMAILASECYLCLISSAESMALPILCGIASVYKVTEYVTKIIEWTLEKSQKKKSNYVVGYEAKKH